jgi:hypothetical protein
LPCRSTISAAFAGGRTSAGGTDPYSAGTLASSMRSSKPPGVSERGARELHVVRGEPGAHSSVAAALEDLEAALSALVDAALAPYGLPPGERALVRAMIDLDTWEAMRGAGVDSPGAAAAVSEMLAARLPTGR